MFVNLSVTTRPLSRRNRQDKFYLGEWDYGFWTSYVVTAIRHNQWYTAESYAPNDAFTFQLVQTAKLIGDPDTLLWRAIREHTSGKGDYAIFWFARKVDAAKFKLMCCGSPNIFTDFRLPISRSELQRAVA